MNLPDYVESVRTFQYTTTTGSETLDFVYTSIAVTNRSDKDIRIYFSNYNRDSFSVVPAGAYKEFAVSSNYFYFEHIGTPSTIDVTIEVLYFANNRFLVNRFPNLFVQDINGNYIQYDPLNTNGFLTETYAFGDATNRPYNSETIISVDYWLNGQKVSTSSGNFYNDLFNTLITNLITSNFPFSEVNDVLRPLPGGSMSEIATRIKNWWESIDRPLNDEYVGGWARLESFDKNLSLVNFVLEPGDKIEFPFTLLGFNIENVGSAVATVEVFDDALSSTKTINPNDTYVGTFERARRFVVNSGRVRLTFSGYLIKMLDFAPIINIYYPLGFDETSGLPNEAYTKFLNELNAFETYLSGIRFSGRVIKYKWVPYKPQDREVWNADYQHIHFKDESIKLPFEEIRPFLRDWYAYAQIENFILSRVWDENYSVLGPHNKPKNLEEVINDDNIVVVLGRNFSSFAPPQRAQEKKEFLMKILKSQYLDNYAGSLNSAYSLN